MELKNKYTYVMLYTEILKQLFLLFKSFELGGVFLSPNFIEKKMTWKMQKRKMNTYFVYNTTLKTTVLTYIFIFSWKRQCWLIYLFFRENNRVVLYTKNVFIFLFCIFQVIFFSIKFGDRNTPPNSNDLNKRNNCFKISVYNITYVYLFFNSITIIKIIVSFFKICYFHIFPSN
jgi:hypothetical protein